MRRERPEEFGRIVLLAFGIQAMVGIPAGVGAGLGGAGGDSVAARRPVAWRRSAGAMAGLTGVFMALVHSNHYMLLALGRMRTLAAYYCIRLALLLGLLLVAFPARRRRRRGAGAPAGCGSRPAGDGLPRQAGHSRSAGLGHGPVGVSADRGGARHGGRRPVIGRNGAF